MFVMFVFVIFIVSFMTYSLMDRADVQLAAVANTWLR